MHRTLVQGYYDARDSRDALRESDAYMQLEYEDFAREHPQVTFKDWLIGHARGRE